MGKTIVFGEKNSSKGYSDLKLQQEEVSDVKYFSKEDLLNRINNNYYELTEKTVSWSILKKILESNVLDQINK